MLKTFVRAMALVVLLAVPAHAAASTADVAAALGRSNAALTEAGRLFAATDETSPRINVNSPALARRRAAALRRLSENRRAFGRAKAAAVRVLREAKTRPARTDAARALSLVAAAQDRTIPTVLDLLVPSTDAAERGLANAHLDLTVGRDQAITLINGLLQAGVTPEAAPKLNAQLVGLVTGRLGDLSKLIAALQSSAVSLASKSTLVRSLDADLAGQALSALGLQSLTGLPESAEKALAAVPGELEAAAGALNGALAVLPPGLRDFVQSVVQRALAAVQILLPTPAAPAPAEPAVPAVPAEPTAPAQPTPLLGTLPGGLPLPVDLRNIFNLLPGLGAPCNVTGFLPSLLPFNPLGFLGTFLPGFSTCPAT